MKKWYYVFIGVRLPSGSPSPTTGRFSQYGWCIKFSSKALRDEYCATCGHLADVCEPCSLTSARKYFLGMSVASYKMYMQGAVREYVKNDFGRFVEIYES